MALTRKEMVKGLVGAIKRLIPDKRIRLSEEKLLSNLWELEIDGVGHFASPAASKILADVRAAQGLPVVDAAALVKEITDCAQDASQVMLGGPEALSV